MQETHQGFLARSIPARRRHSLRIATMSNREWGSIGTNYLKGLFALAFQGFLIMICVGIYAVLINNMIIAANITCFMKVINGS